MSRETNALNERLYEAKRRLYMFEQDVRRLTTQRDELLAACAFMLESWDRGQPKEGTTRILEAIIKVFGSIPKTEPGKEE